MDAPYLATVDERQFMDIYILSYFFIIVSHKMSPLLAKKGLRWLPKMVTSWHGFKSSYIYKSQPHFHGAD